MGTLKASLKDEMTSPVVETANAGAEASCCTHRSIETLVVVLAVITIVGVIAGIIAKLCGGRHFGGNGENDIEGWVEKKCRSCLDGGISAETPPPPPPPPPPPEEPKPTAEETKK
ncbi:mulatexin [Mangifera indica]|uniref:mulatexin n=1 Tax=Mangifera indica TaxID=29780 RepID=UPI001CF980E7|nr:mulatexin [Mangifera indica]